jgi:hypothetical protein
MSSIWFSHCPQVLYSSFSLCTIKTYDILWNHMHSTLFFILVESPWKTSPRIAHARAEVDRAGAWGWYWLISWTY